jgi:hypothetical protein
MSDAVPKEVQCETRQSEANIREDIGAKSSMAARLGIMAPNGNQNASVPQGSCPTVTGANCAVNSHPVMIHSSKAEALPAKCR